MKYRGILHIVRAEQPIKKINGKFSEPPRLGKFFNFISKDLAGPVAAALDGAGFISIKISEDQTIGIKEDRLYSFQTKEADYLLEVTEVKPDSDSVEKKRKLPEGRGL